MRVGNAEGNKGHAHVKLEDLLVLVRLWPCWSLRPTCGVVSQEIGRLPRDVGLNGLLDLSVSGISSLVSPPL
jgi:hypothetical protein